MKNDDTIKVNCCRGRYPGERDFISIRIGDDFIRIDTPMGHNWEDMDPKVNGKSIDGSCVIKRRHFDEEAKGCDDE